MKKFRLLPLLIAAVFLVFLAGNLFAQEEIIEEEEEIIEEATTEEVVEEEVVEEEVTEEPSHTGFGSAVMVTLTGTDEVIVQLASTTHGVSLQPRFVSQPARRPRISTSVWPVVAIRSPGLYGTQVPLPS